MVDFKVGDKVTYQARANSAVVKGEVVKAAETSGEGKARKTFVTIKGEDDAERRVMPSRLMKA